MSAPLLTGCTGVLTGCPDCKGHVEWSKDSGRWRGKCNKCSLTTRATTFEAAGLDERAGASRG